jgi:hypothetical protein
MKHLSIAIVFILVFSFCKNKTKNNAEFKSELIKNDSTFRLSEHYSKFKFHDLKEFKTDTFDIIERRKHFARLDSLAITQIIQGNKKLLTSNSFFYHCCFSNSTSITLIQELNGELGVEIWLLKFDKLGKLKSTKLIAASLDDLGASWYSNGKFIKKYIAISTSVNSLIIDGEIDNSRIVIDSTIVGLDNTIKLDRLFSKTDTILQKIDN